MAMWWSFFNGRSFAGLVEGRFRRAGGAPETHNGGAVMLGAQLQNCRNEDHSGNGQK
jgi:hypothetical protein